MQGAVHSRRKIDHWGEDKENEHEARHSDKSDSLPHLCRYSMNADSFLLFVPILIE
jgi:hypothetical protein